jgi:hypothetical protein
MGIGVQERQGKAKVWQAGIQCRNNAALESHLTKKVMGIFAFATEPLRISQSPNSKV